METRQPENLEQWTDEKLAALAAEESQRVDGANGLQRFHDRRRKSASRSRRWVVAGAGASIAVGSIAAVPQGRVMAAKCLQVCGIESNLIDSILAPATGSASVAASGAGFGINRQPAPEFTAIDLDGKEISLAKLRGKIVMVNFWAPWCPPCRTEIPWFIAFQNSYREKGLVIVGVSMDEDGERSVRPFVEERGVNYPVITVGGEIAERFGGVTSLPATALIDRKGRTIKFYSGLIDRSEYEAAISAALLE